MADLPLKGRGFYDLALLSGAVAPRMPSSFVASRRPTPGGLNAPAFSVAGAREKSNGYLIDGVDAQDPHYLTPSFVPSVDAIQEFKLETNAYPAEFGRYAAQVNATTRSGGNDFHGSLFHFLRNDLFDAANFFDNFTGRGKAPLRYNQFGGTIGGPVSSPKKYFGPLDYEGRDRTFFFFNYQGTRTRRGRTAQLNVPTPEQRNGDFSRLNFRGNRPIFDPLTTRPNPAGSGVIRDPFPNNRIPESRITPFAREILKLYPLPTSDVATGNNFFATLSDRSDHDQILGRLDHRFNERNSLSFRYALFDGIESNKSPIDQGGQATDVRTHNIALSFLHTFGARTVNELRLGYNRPTYLILQDGAFTNDYATLLGLKNLLRDPVGFGVPQIGLTGFSGIGTDTNPTTQVSNVYQIVNILSLIRGSHSLKTGADLRKVNYNDRSERFVRGSFSFTGAMTANPQNRATTGVPIADLLLGLPLTAGGSSTSLAGNFNGFTYGFFAQDDWKVSRRLTLNLGLRYELNTRYTDVQNRLTRFDSEFPGGRLLIAGTNKAYIPTRGIVDGVETSRGLIETDTNNFAPRVGFAYSLNDKTVIRSAFGIFYAGIFTNLGGAVNFPGFTIQQNFPNLGVGVAQPFSLSQGFPLVAVRTNDPFAVERAATVDNPLAPTAQFEEIGPLPQTLQLTVNVQRELFAGVMAEAVYVGSRGLHLPLDLPFNQIPFERAEEIARDGTTAARQRARPFPTIGGFNARLHGGTSTYHSLQLKGRRQFGSGLTFVATYTWAKSLDDGSGVIDAGVPNGLDAGQYPSRFRFLDRAVSSFDLPHNFSAAAVYTHERGPAFLRGFQISPTVLARSGFPDTIAQTNLNPAVNQQRPSVNGDYRNVYVPDFISEGVGIRYLRATNDPQFPLVPTGPLFVGTGANRRLVLPASIGTLGRNTIREPGQFDINLAVGKRFALTEELKLMFRAEAFNLLNRTNFDLPNSALAVIADANGNAVFNSPNFGLITVARSARFMQLVLRLEF